MDGITWDELFGMPYEKDLDPAKGIKVDLRKKRPAPFCPMVVSMKKALGGAVLKVLIEDFGRGAVTPHTAGAALDIHYHANDPDKKAFAHGLIELFIRHRAKLQFGVVLYNNMQFTPSDAVAKTVGHVDHVHIDWIDYSSVVRSKAFTSFKFIDEDGKEQVKNVGDDDQKMKMLWNAGARGGSTTDFETDLAALNRDFDTRKPALGALKVDDFKALYSAPPPTPISPPDKHTLWGPWYDEDGLVVHPDAPAGRGGFGRFRTPGPLATNPLGYELPHPWSPAARTLCPLDVRQFAKEREDFYRELGG